MARDTVTGLTPARSRDIAAVSRGACCSHPFPRLGRQPSSMSTLATDARAVTVTHDSAFIGRLTALSFVPSVRLGKETAQHRAGVGARVKTRADHVGGALADALPLPIGSATKGGSHREIEYAFEPRGRRRGGRADGLRRRPPLTPPAPQSSPARPPMPHATCRGRPTPSSSNIRPRRVRTASRSPTATSPIPGASR